MIDPDLSILEAVLQAKFDILAQRLDSCYIKLAISEYFIWKIEFLYNCNI